MLLESTTSQRINKMDIQIEFISPFAFMAIRRPFHATKGHNQGVVHQDMYHTPQDLPKAKKKTFQTPTQPHPTPFPE